MRRTFLAALASFLIAAASPGLARAAETCGDHADNDGDNLADEGCAPDLVSGICTQPGGCYKTGWVGPKSGQLVWPEPADLAPAVAYGPGIPFKRTYFGQYEPGYLDPNDTDFRAPLGRGWTHNYMSFVDWIDIIGSATDAAVVHTTSGQDIYFTEGTASGGWDYYTPQAGHNYIHLRQNQSSPYQWELKDLTGWIYEYDYSGTTGKLKKITDSVGNYITITYNGDGQVDKVLDATGNRGLEFSYYTSAANDKLLQYVKYRTYSAGSGTDRVTLEFTYSSYKLTSAKIGTSTPATFRTYTYDNKPNLTKIEDGESTPKVIAEFKYYSPSGGALTNKVVRIETSDGTFGWEFAASGCDSGNGTYVTYQRSSSSSGCSSCAGDEYCGGKTDVGDSSTGLCFEARVCLALSSATVEDLVGAVTASCSSCTDTSEFAWDTGSTKLDLKGRKSPRADGANAIWTTYEYNSNGLVTKMIEGDTNSDPSDVPSNARVTYYKYDNSSFPGLVTEIRRKSELQSGTCDASTTTACKRTIYTYTSGGLLDTLQEAGFTETASGGVASYSFTTDYTYDAQGRVTQIDGPRTDTSYDITEFTYWTGSADVLKDYFLKEVKRKKATSTYLTTEFGEYDYWGNAKQHKPPVADLVCHVYDGARNVLTSRRYAMGSQSDCSTVESNDETTQWTYDTALRVTKEQRERGDCIHYEYDGSGRLSKRKDRDDCTASSDGDTMEYTYSADGLLTMIQYKDDDGTVTWEQEYAYRADRRLDKVTNPVLSGTQYTRQWDYENDGLLKKVTDGVVGGTVLGQTEWLYDAIARLDLEKRYTASGASDDWNLTPGVQLDLPTQVQDEDSKAIDWKWDDMGRKIKQVTPDAGTNWFEYDPAGNLTTVRLAYGSADVVTNTYTYDSLDRMTAENTGDTSCGGEQGAEIQYVYDATPSGCPSGQTCINLSGRLAYVKLKLACDTSKSDDTIDQETFFSYENHGRLNREFIQDDTTRTALTTYAFDDNGNMTQVLPPSAIKFHATRGSATYNDDMNKVRTVYRTEDTVDTNIITSVTWRPFGPIKQYLQEHTKNSNKIKLATSHNLAYRPTEFLWEEQTSGTDLVKIAFTEDDEGRITIRDFTSFASGVQDAYYTYDWHDRVTCDSAASGSCPTSGSNLKSNMSGSPPFTASNDRKVMKHSDPLVGEDTYTYTLVSGKDQVDYIDKTSYNVPGVTNDIDFSWDTRGNRTADNDAEWTHDQRTYTYDARNNLITVSGDYLYASNDWNAYTITNVYDHRNRRIFKSFLDSDVSEEAQWYFTYDQTDRLVEVKHIPDTDVTTTYSIYDFYWIEDRPVAYYQLDFQSGQGTVTTRRFLHADEINRPLEAWAWPSSGDTTRVWAINPDLFAWDYTATGSGLYQPLRFPGQHCDPETVAYRPDGSNSKVARPALSVHAGDLFFDPLSGGFLQTAPTASTFSQSYSFSGQDPVHVDTSAQTVYADGAGGVGADIAATICKKGVEGCFNVIVKKPGHAEIHCTVCCYKDKAPTWSCAPAEDAPFDPSGPGDKTVLPPYEQGIQVVAAPPQAPPMPPPKPAGEHTPPSSGLPNTTFCPRRHCRMSYSDGETVTNVHPL